MLRISSSYFISLLSCYSSKLFLTRVILTSGNKSSQIFNCRFKSKICDLDSLTSVYSNNLYFILYFYDLVPFQNRFIVSLLSYILLKSICRIYPFVTFSLLLLTMARRRRNFVFETRKYLIFVSPYRRRKILCI